MRMRKQIPLLATAGLAVALLAEPSHAQQPTSRTPAAESENDALTDKVRELFDEGVKAANAGRWRDAHVSFLAAWRLKEHYQIASNLGVAELKLGKYREAAKHLAWYLQEAPATKVEQRRRAEGSLKEALAKVASVTVEVEPAGAEVTVDGAPVGKAPLKLPVFLDPGEHEIAARLDGHVPEKRAVTAKAGETATVSLRLAARTAGPAVQMGNGPIAPGTTTPPRDTSGPSKPVLYTGMALAGVAAGVGVVFGIVSMNKESDADALHVELEREGGEYACDALERADRCARLRDLRVDAWNYTKAAWGSFGGAAVIGAATFIYYWTASPPSDAAARVQVIPQLADKSGGVVVTGTW
ncbi:PEGA domain-containing protein [Sorangium sp. So ce1335]|uniref:PEGA domain-containing protein n=1 Tax=Sorangium sp. So ce1335 TaxID=3133335 RepID=UPI003F627734